MLQSLQRSLAALALLTLSSAAYAQKGPGDSGASLFQQNCAFCHGRDAGGGETGPDLTASRLVADDKNADKIGVVVRNGRPDKGMPRFDLTDQQIADLAAFIHARKNESDAHPGRRRGVEVSDLQTGNAEEGKRYFSGAGGCTKCHSITGDLAHFAAHNQGLKLEERLLYPHDPKATAKVRLRSGETVEGELAYQDEFTIAVRDSSGTYRSWRTRDVRFTIDAPAEAHAALLAKYTDDDIHNLVAFLQTLK